MSCFVLNDLELHQVVYAHALDMTDYHFSFSTSGFGNYYPATDERSGLLEIGYVLKTPLIIENHTLGETYTAEEGDVFLFPPQHDITVHAKDGAPHKHVTSEFMVSGTVEVCPHATVADKLTGDVRASIALPYIIPAETVHRSVKGIIHRLAADHSLLVNKSYFAQCADFYSLLEGLRRSADPEELVKPYISPKYKAHCKRAEEYIEQHILEPINISEIANAIGLSKNYLINIFSEYKGMGLTEYINRVKLNRMLLLISHYGYSMKQACEYVSFNDANYISRIFRRYYGVSFKEYCYNLKMLEQRR
ncbi:MAG: AraC family transcriptional regulator [Clostridia bacterium]|nr:AraC family transcriptional regulator [Clostridia bacterium]